MKKIRYRAFQVLEYPLRKLIIVKFACKCKTASSFVCSLFSIKNAKCVRETLRIAEDTNSCVNSQGQLLECFKNQNL